MSTSQISFSSLDHIRPSAREVFRGLLQAIENEPQPILSVVYKVPRPESLGSRTVPRPPNPFVLFKSWISKAFGRNEAAIAGELWQELQLASSPVVTYFSFMAIDAKRKHLEVFPDYRYRPRRTNQPNIPKEEANSSSSIESTDALAQAQLNADLHHEYRAVDQAMVPSANASHITSASQATSPHGNVNAYTRPFPLYGASSGTAALSSTTGLNNAVHHRHPVSDHSFSQVSGYGVFPGGECLHLYSPNFSPNIDSPEHEPPTPAQNLTDSMELAPWETMDAAAVALRAFAQGQPQWNVNIGDGDTGIYNSNFDFDQFFNWENL